MSSLVVSDLHLGSRRSFDAAREADLRAPLLELVSRCDEVVLAGDVLELRDGPDSAALERARPFFEDLGEAAAGRRVTLMAGNHDHQLIARWLEARRLDEGRPLEIEQRFAPHDASPHAERLAATMPRCEVELAYPGAWVRDGVYVHHGHYLDRHLTIPSLECLAGRALARLTRRTHAGLRGPDSYEAIFAPLYALMHGVAQSVPADLHAPGANSSHAAWRVLVGDGGRRPTHHKLAAALGFPLAVWTLNAAGLGPLEARLSPVELRRSALRAITAAMERLGVQGDHIVFGHTHRAGPRGRDRPEEWRTPSGARLHNCGSWVYEDLFVTSRSGESPYWPGRCVEVPDTGDPVLRGLLDDVDHERFTAPPPA